MDNLTELITAAVDDVNTGADDADISDGAGSNDTSTSGNDMGATSAVTTDAGSPAGDGVGQSKSTSTTPDSPTVPAVDPLAKDLEELGLKAPEEGQRENRIPYSRVRKIVENAQKKVEGRFTSELGEVRTKLTAAEAKAKQMDVADNLIATDPARYLQMLAMLHPAYKQYLEPKTAPTTVAAPTPTQPATATDPMPQPDHKFEDGSMGYTAEGYQKVTEWQIRQAENRAFERLERTQHEQRERDATATKLHQEAAATTAEWQRQARETWGKAYDDDVALNDKSEILTYMRANPRVPFPAAVAAVLTPKLRVDRDKMREEIHTELNTRPAAAAKTVGGGKKPAEASTGPRTMEDVIREAMASSGLRA